MLEKNLFQMKITQITHLYTSTDIFSSEVSDACTYSDC